MSTLTINYFGSKAAARLERAVGAQWFLAVGRVHLWRDTLAAAYSAVFEEDGSRLITLPDGATTPDGETVDTADNILNAFDSWLGRGVVYWAGGGCEECGRWTLTTEEIAYGHDCEVDG